DRQLGIDQLVARVLRAQLALEVPISVFFGGWRRRVERRRGIRVRRLKPVENLLLAELKISGDLLHRRRAPEATGQLIACLLDGKRALLPAPANTHGPR